MTEKRTTNRQHFETLLTLDDVMSRPDLVEFIERQIAVLDKKNANKKPTEKQIANKGILEDILDHMSADPNRLFSISEIVKEVPSCTELSNQKISSIIRPVLGSSIERVEDKRKAYFKYMAD